MRHFSIRGRLLAALIAFIVAYSSFSGYAITKIRGLEGITSSIYHDPLEVSSAAMEAMADILKIKETIKEILLSTDDEEIRQEKLRLKELENNIYSNFDKINSHSVNKQTLQILEFNKESFAKWRENHNYILESLMEGRRQEAMDISQSNNGEYTDFLEKNLILIDRNAKLRASDLVKQAGKFQKQLEILLIALNVVFGMFFTLIFSLVIRSIVKSINQLQQAMDESAVTGVLKDAVIEGSSEISGIAKNYNMLMQKLKHEFWLKDGQNELNHTISEAASLQEMMQRALNFTVKEVGAGKGALYIYNESTKHLELQSSYAYTQKEQRFGSYALGEGIIGQAALERRPICIENIREYEGYISTGVTLEAPISIYTFPLIFKDMLHGVIELASFEEFCELKREFLREAAEIIAANVYSGLQSHKVKSLLEISERAQMEARYSAGQLLKTNQVLEEQQLRLQQQSEELQNSNAELEEQQQLLQQQSEELQQTNMQLEEQQQLMEEQAKLLNMRNIQLEETGYQLIKRSRELEAANKYKSQFLTNMSHELRTPLNSIILLSRLLMKNENKEMNKQQMEKLDVIYSSGQELLRLINDVLDLSKIESGKMEVELEEFHTADLLNELKKMFESSTHDKNIEYKCVDFLDIKLYADYNKIAQILRNLLSNAIKFTEKGSVGLEINQDANGSVQMIVSDTGIGISKDNIKNIFDEFKQADGSISRKYGGTGLGLSISKKLAEIINGEILVESEEGVGSTFTLLLKKNIKSELLIEEAAEEIAVGYEQLDAAEASKESNANRKILVIEDDAAFAENIQKINSSMGFNTIIAATGMEGLLMAKEAAVDAILLDLSLPDISGMEILRELKSIKELRSIPVHVITAREKKGAAHKLDAVVYKQKSMSDGEIADIVASMFNMQDRKSKRLLIVEDNEIQQNAMKELLEPFDIVIDTAYTEEAAKKQIENNDYDAIILDLELAAGNGLNVCKYMHRKKYEIPIIVYTGRDLTMEQERDIRKYADSIIIKTVNSDARLLDEVTLFLHKIKKIDSRLHYLSSKTSKQDSLNLEGKKILIVDDDPRNVFVLASTLEDFGAEILEAENGSEALMLLEKNELDLILMDIMMPEMDGYQTIRAIRSKEALENIPIIAVTAKSLKDDRDKCIEAGADDYISKPVDYDTMVKLIKAWISK